MAHTIRADLTNLNSLAAALKDLQWYTSSAGGYRIVTVQTEGTSVTWDLDTIPVETKSKAPSQKPEQRKTVEPGDRVIVETKAQQIARRFGDAVNEGVEGIVFRVLTRGPHPHGMKVELRDRTVGRVIRNLTVPGAGEAKN